MSGEEQNVNSMNSTQMTETATEAATSRDTSRGSGLTDAGACYQIWTNPINDDDRWTSTDELPTNELGESDQVDTMQNLNNIDSSTYMMETATSQPWTDPMNLDNRWNFPSSYGSNELMLTPRTPWNQAHGQEATTQGASVVYDATDVSKNSSGGYSHIFQNSYAQQMY